MPRKDRFPQEPDTIPKPGASKTASKTARQSGPAPKGSRERSEAPTLPPPGREGATAQRSARGGAATRKGPNSRAASGRSVKGGMPAATVDEVTAALSNDPRRGQDERAPTRKP